MKPPVWGIYVIADPAVAGDELIPKTEQLLEAGIDLLQFRAKSLGLETKGVLARRLRELCRRHQIPFLVNDDVDLAEWVGADGVHLGKHDPTVAYARSRLGEQAIIGLSCYGEVERARWAGSADYLAFGRFFPSATKPRALQAEPEILTRARAVSRLPVVAIGGITAENCQPLIQAGADALAIAGGLYSTDCPAEQVEKIRRLLAEKQQEKSQS